jgi:hypothetical protein
MSRPALSWAFRVANVRQTTLINTVQGLEAAARASVQQRAVALSERVNGDLRALVETAATQRTASDAIIELSAVYAAPDAAPDAPRHQTTAATIHQLMNEAARAYEAVRAEVTDEEEAKTLDAEMVRVAEQVKATELLATAPRTKVAPEPAPARAGAAAKAAAAAAPKASRAKAPRGKQDDGNEDDGGDGGDGGDDNDFCPPTKRQKPLRGAAAVAAQKIKALSHDEDDSEVQEVVTPRSSVPSTNHAQGAAAMNMLMLAKWTSAAQQLR